MSLGSMKFLRYNTKRMTYKKESNKLDFIRIKIKDIDTLKDTIKKSKSKVTD